MVRIAERKDMLVGYIGRSLNNPDAGLVLRANFVRGLKRSVQAKKRGQCKALDSVLGNP